MASGKSKSKELDLVSMRTREGRTRLHVRNPLLNNSINPFTKAVPGDQTPLISSHLLTSPRRGSSFLHLNIGEYIPTIALLKMLTSWSHSQCMGKKLIPYLMDTLGH